MNIIESYRRLFEPPRDPIHEPHIITWPLRTVIADQRKKELFEGQPNEYREKGLVYKYALENQRAEDSFIKILHPIESLRINMHLGQPNTRWMAVQTIAFDVQDYLKYAGGPRCIIDCRAKSNYRILEKMRRHNVLLEEVFDYLGVRIITDGMADALRVCGLLEQEYTMMRPHRFHRRGDVHMPKRNTFPNPKPDTQYAGVHYNFYSPDGAIFEIQVSTRQVFWNMLYKSQDAIASTALY